jgi:tetratricopeptide (TPR) repeat protein
MYGQKPYEGNALTSIKYFLANDIHLAEKYISKAIVLDSNNLDYFYFRATINLYLNDTSKAFCDFVKAVNIKKRNKKLYSDSLMHSFVMKMPRHNTNNVESEFLLDPEFEKVKQAVWLYLYKKNKNSSCADLRNTQLGKIEMYKKLVDSICK